MHYYAAEQQVTLQQLVEDVADACASIDASGVPFKAFQPGVGPYGEPQLVKQVAGYLNALPAYRGRAASKRTPDLLIRGFWALEFKIARPFGDNGAEAENCVTPRAIMHQGSSPIVHQQTSPTMRQ